MDKDFICKCGHREDEHTNFGAINRYICNVRNKDEFVDDCRQFKADNLKYLEMKVEEKQRIS